MSEKARSALEEMLIVEWSGKTMLSSSTGLPIGADSWPLSSRISAWEGPGPGLVQTDLAELASGILAIFEQHPGPPAAPSWLFALEAPEIQNLRLSALNQDEPLVNPQTAHASDLARTGLSPVSLAPPSRQRGRRGSDAGLARSQTGLPPVKPDLRSPRAQAAYRFTPSTVAPAQQGHPTSIPGFPGHQIPQAGRDGPIHRAPAHDLLVALRMRTPDDDAPATRSSGLTSVMDLSRFAAASARSPRRQVQAGAGIDPDSARELPVRAVRALSLNTGSPESADVQLLEHLLPTRTAGGSTPSSTTHEGPGMDPRWIPGIPFAQAAGTHITASMGPALARLVAIAEGPLASDARSSTSAPGPLSEAAFLDLSPAHPQIDVSSGLTSGRPLVPTIAGNRGRPYATDRFRDESAGRTSARLASQADPVGAAHLDIRQHPPPMAHATTYGPGSGRVPDQASTFTGLTAQHGTPMSAERTFLAPSGFRSSGPADPGGGVNPTDDLAGAILATMGRGPSRLPMADDFLRPMDTFGTVSAAHPPIFTGGNWTAGEQWQTFVQLNAAPDDQTLSASATGAASDTFRGPPRQGSAARGTAASASSRTLAATRGNKQQERSIRKPAQAGPVAAGNPILHTGWDIRLAPQPRRSAAGQSPRFVPTGIPFAGFMSANDIQEKVVLQARSFESTSANLDRSAEDSFSGLQRDAIKTRQTMGEIPLPESFDLVNMALNIFPATPRSLAGSAVGSVESPFFLQGQHPAAKVAGGQASAPGMPPIGGASPESWPLSPGHYSKGTDTLSFLQRTLVRSLRGLPPEAAAKTAGSSSSAAEATRDLVEGILLQGRSQSLSFTGPVEDRFVTSGDRTSRVLSTSTSLHRDAETSPERTLLDTSHEQKREPVWPTSLPWVQPGAPTERSASLVNVSTSGRLAAHAGSLASPLGSLAGIPQTGQALHGGFPLVSTALSTVAATAMTASRDDEPATRPAAAGPDRNSAAGASIDLDGLAAEMSERILRRFKRDKERRGFYG